MITGKVLDNIGNSKEGGGGGGKKIKDDAPEMVCLLCMLEGTTKKCIHVKQNFKMG